MVLRVLLFVSFRSSRCSALPDNLAQGSEGFAGRFSWRGFYRHNRRFRRWLACGRLRLTNHPTCECRCRARFYVIRCPAQRLTFRPKPVNHQSAEPLLPTGCRDTLQSVYEDCLQCDTEIKVQDNPIPGLRLSHALASPACDLGLDYGESGTSCQ